MGVSEQIQEELRQGRSPEEVLERLKGKGLSEANARRFLERAQAAAAAGGATPGPTAVPAPRRPVRTTPERADDEGDGTWAMATGAFFFFLGLLGTALTYVMAKPGGKFTLLYGAILWGAFSFIRGLRRWRGARPSRPFPALHVAAGVALPALIVVGIYVQGARQRAASRERAVQLVRDEEQRRGVESTGAAAPLDPVSTYIVVLKNGGRDPDSQREAAWRLGEMKPAPRDAVPALLDALRSPSASVRRSAGEALLKIDRENPAVAAAVKGLFADPSHEVWEAMVRDFAQRGDPEARKAALAKLDDPDIWWRDRACGVLGGLRDDRAFAEPHLIAKVRSDADWRVKAGCARALGQLGSATPEAKAALEEAARSQIPDVQRAGADGLAKLASGGR
jgi:hypothetical protein